MSNDSFGGPYLTAAFLCERVLQEKDGVLSYIRVVDRFMVPMLGPKLPPGVQLAGPPPALQTNLIVSLKAGSLGSGKYTIRVKLFKPDGSQMQDNTHSVFFNGSDDNGVLLAARTVLIGPEEGLYWFEIYFEETLITRIPMRVLHQQIGLPPQFQQGKL